MKRTGIKATAAEVADLRGAANAPIIGGPGMGSPRDPTKMAHDLALKHGLPEIPGYYGIDLSTGEFLTSDNAPLPEGLQDKVQPSARELVERVLGKGVHPSAVDRLFELWPEAHVEVRHDKVGGADFNVRRTFVFIDSSKDAGNAVAGVASCHPHDNYERRKGIDLAFRRALVKVPR